MPPKLGGALSDMLFLETDSVKDSSKRLAELSWPLLLLPLSLRQCHATGPGSARLSFAVSGLLKAFKNWTESSGTGEVSAFFFIFSLPKQQQTRWGKGRVVGGARVSHTGGGRKLAWDEKPLCWNLDDGQLIGLGLETSPGGADVTAVAFNVHRFNSFELLWYSPDFFCMQTSQCNLVFKTTVLSFAFFFYLRFFFYQVAFFSDFSSVFFLSPPPASFLGWGLETSSTFFLIFAANYSLTFAGSTFPNTVSLLVETSALTDSTPA